MKICRFAMWVALTLVPCVALAQSAPFNELGVTMGHWHLLSKDEGANQKFFLALGATKVTHYGAPRLAFPGVFVNLNATTDKGEGGSQGSVVDHVGLTVKNLQESIARWKAEGLAVQPGKHPNQVFVETPDGVLIEIVEDKNQTEPIRNDHVHLFLLKGEIPKAQAWYAKVFGGKIGTHRGEPVVDAPGVQIRFRVSDAKRLPTLGRVLDHIGFDVKDIQAFVKRIQAEGVNTDDPIRTIRPGVINTHLTDPWGTRIEIVQGD